MTAKELIIKLLELPLSVRVMYDNDCRDTAVTKVEYNNVYNEVHIS